VYKFFIFVFLFFIWIVYWYGMMCLHSLMWSQLRSGLKTWSLETTWKEIKIMKICSSTWHDVILMISCYCSSYKQQTRWWYRITENQFLSKLTSTSLFFSIIHLLHCCISNPKWMRKSHFYWCNTIRVTYV
jgi:hypothetical protein